jgi:pimeloyl-ACP methyl ester carboxylesterase
VVTEGLTARPWVLLPGTLCTGAAFDGMLDCLGVPTDLRTTLPVREARVDAYGPALEAVPDHAVICGFSLGSVIAAHHANRLRCARLILFACTHLSDDPAKADGRRAFATQVAESGGAAALAPSLTALKGPDPAGARAIILDMADQTAGDVAAQTDLSIGRPGAATELSACRVPVWFLTGTEDQQTPPDIARAAAEITVGGVFRSIDGTGHYALIENPRACADAILDLERRMG